MGSRIPRTAVDNEEPTRILGYRETRTEFYTYNKKNEALQAMLDKEYEKLRSGEEPEEEPGAAGVGDGAARNRSWLNCWKRQSRAGRQRGRRPGGRRDSRRIPPVKKKKKWPWSLWG